MTPQLRPYQQLAVDAAVQTIEQQKNGIIVAPSGSGKSLLIASLATQLDCRMIVLQPSKEILGQNFSKLYEFGCRDMDVFSASCGRKQRARITLGTIGSVINRLDMFVGKTDVVLVDECHLVGAKQGQYKELIEAIGKPVIGLTATPYRMHAWMGGSVVEAKFLHRTRPRIFSEICHITQSADLHRDGWLASIKYEADDDYDPRKIALKSTGLNYDEQALAQYHHIKNICRKAADTVIFNRGVTHFLIFAASIQESKTIIGMLLSRGITAAHIDGTTSATERRQTLLDFQAGKIRAVSNMQVMTTGYDFPALDGIVLARPTMSLPLHYQMIGRGVRNAPKKEACYVFDLCGNVEKFGRPDEYHIESCDNGLHRLRSENQYLTGINFRTGQDLEKRRLKRSETKAATLTPLSVVTFGRYNGTPLEEIPVSYMHWCAKTFDDGKWKAAFLGEIQRRSSMASCAANA